MKELIKFVVVLMKLLSNIWRDGWQIVSLWFLGGLDIIVARIIGL